MSRALLGCREAEELFERRGIAMKLQAINKGQQESHLPILFLFINAIVIGTLMWLTVSVID